MCPLFRDIIFVFQQPLASKWSATPLLRFTTKKKYSEKRFWRHTTAQIICVRGIGLKSFARVENCPTNKGWIVGWVIHWHANENLSAHVNVCLTLFYPPPKTLRGHERHTKKEKNRVNGPKWRKFGFGFYFKGSTLIRGGHPKTLKK